MKKSTDGAPQIDVEINDGLRIIKINNPKKRNALTLMMWEALTEEVERANADADTRVVVVTGAGDRAFTSGADISEFSTKRSTQTQIQHYDEAIDRAQLALTACVKPTIALIRGVCMGGGMEIAAACDLRYTIASATFRMPAARVGLGYSLDGIARMVDILGPATTQDLFLTARFFDGTEAARIGFVNESFSDDTFEKLSQARVLAILANAPMTLSAVKISVAHLLGRANCPSAQQVDAAVAACFKSDDYQEGQNAYKEKRDPTFKGV